MHHRRPYTLRRVGGNTEPDPEERGKWLRVMAVHWRDGREKLFLIQEMLRFRQRHPELFAQGDYEPLQAEGDKAAHVCAFARRWNEQMIIVAAPRLLAKLSTGAADALHDPALWCGTSLPLLEGRWRNLFTGRQFNGGRQSIADLVSSFPVVVLARSA